MAHLHFAKRDSTSETLKPFLYTFYVCLGMAGLLAAGYAIHRLLGMDNDSSGYKPRTAEQDDYMREVRQRNLDGLMAELRGKGRR